jgi:hypothetical protein
MQIGQLPLLEIAVADNVEEVALLVNNALVIGVINPVIVADVEVLLQVVAPFAKISN